MATVQISFTDNSDNEDNFNVYRGDNTGANPDVTSVANVVATVTWNSGTNQWDIANGALATDAAFVGSAPTDAPSTVGNAFTFNYTEDNAGTYKYSVEAENSIGKSAATVSSGDITIA